MTNQTIIMIGVVAFVVLAEIAALFMYVYDTIHNIPVPTQTISFITMGLTYAFSALSHQQGSQATVKGSDITLPIKDN